MVKNTAGYKYKTVCCPMLLPVHRQFADNNPCALTHDTCSCGVKSPSLHVTAAHLHFPPSSHTLSLDSNKLSGPLGPPCAASLVVNNVCRPKLSQACNLQIACAPTSASSSILLRAASPINIKCRLALAHPIPSFNLSNVVSRCLGTSSGTSAVACASNSLICATKRK